MKDGSFADKVGYVVSNAQVGAFDALGSHSTEYGSVRMASIIARVNAMSLAKTSAQGYCLMDPVCGIDDSIAS